MVGGMIGRILIMTPFPWTVMLECFTSLVSSKDENRSLTKASNCTTSTIIKFVSIVFGRWISCSAREIFLRWLWGDESLFKYSLERQGTFF